MNRLNHLPDLLGEFRFTLEYFNAYNRAYNELTLENLNAIPLVTYGTIHFDQVICLWNRYYVQEFWNRINEALLDPTLANFAMIPVRHQLPPDFIYPDNMIKYIWEVDALIQIILTATVET